MDGNLHSQRPNLLFDKKLYDHGNTQAQGICMDTETTHLISATGFVPPCHPYPSFLQAASSNISYGCGMLFERFYSLNNSVVG